MVADHLGWRIIAHLNLDVRLRQLRCEMLQGFFHDFDRLNLLRLTVQGAQAEKELTNPGGHAINLADDVAHALL
ncbi:hypothetical protein D3C80_1934160 [compost metagenome]